MRKRSIMSRQTAMDRLWRYREWVVLAIYMALTLWFSTFYIPWEDEVQAWLIARDCNLWEIVGMMRYEGHFLPWVLILVPFAKTGFSMWAMKPISIFFMSVFVFLFLKRAPFPFWPKVLFVFGLPCAFLYPIVSRCYSLVPLAVICLCITYKERYAKPMPYMLSLLFLFNTHVMMLVFVAIIFCDYLYGLYRKEGAVADRGKAIRAVIVFMVLAFLSIAPMFGCLGTNENVVRQLSYPFTKRLATSFEKFFELLFFVWVDFLMESPFLSKLFFGVLSLSTFAFVVIVCLCDAYVGKRVLLSTAVYWSFLGGFVYDCANSRQKSALLFFVFLYYFWVCREHVAGIAEDVFYRMGKGLLCLFLVAGVLSLSIFVPKLMCDDSSVLLMADYMNRNLDDRSIVFTVENPHPYVNIIAHTDGRIRFFDIMRQRFYTYCVWDNPDPSRLFSEKDLGFLEYDFASVSADKFYFLNAVPSDRPYAERKVLDRLFAEGVLVEVASYADGFYPMSYCLYRVDMDGFRKLYGKNRK